MQKTTTIGRAIAVAGTLTAMLGACRSQQDAGTGGADGVAEGDADRTRLDAPEEQGPTATLYVKGLPCPFCLQNVESQLERVMGVRRVESELATGRFRVLLDPRRQPTREQLIKAVDESGFTLDSIEMP